MFAALTVIFTKIGGENVHSDFATLIRTLVILLVLAGIVAAPADSSCLVRSPAGPTWFLVFPVSRPGHPGYATTGR